MQICELGRAQGIFVDPLILFKTTASLCLDKSKCYLRGVLATGGCFVPHLFCWQRLSLILACNLDKKILETSHEIRFSFKKAKHIGVNKKNQTLFLK